MQGVSLTLAASIPDGCGPFPAGRDRTRLKSIGACCELYTVQGGQHGMGGWERDPKLQGWKPVLTTWLKPLK